MTNSIQNQVIAKTTTGKVIATEILNQLGGNQFLAMTGASVAYYAGTVCVKFKGSPKANIMYISLNASDTYTVKIAKSVNYKFFEVFSSDNMYAEQLQSVFTKVTGLYTRL